MQAVGWVRTLHGTSLLDVPALALPNPVTTRPSVPRPTVPPVLPYAILPRGWEAERGRGPWEAVEETDLPAGKHVGE